VESHKFDRFFAAIYKSRNLSPRQTFGCRGERFLIAGASWSVAAPAHWSLEVF
jgi:hypothetical protein